MTRIDLAGEIHTNDRLRTGRKQSVSSSDFRSRQQKTPMKGSRGAHAAGTVGDRCPPGTATTASSTSSLSPSFQSLQTPGGRYRHSWEHRPRPRPRPRAVLEFLKQLDMYGATPSYDVPSFKSWVGVFMTALTLAIFLPYVGSTFYQYIVKAPDLFYQGEIPVVGIAYDVPQVVAINVEYADSTGTGQILDADNLDRFFRLRAVHTTVRNRDAEPREYLDLKFKSCWLPGPAEDSPKFRTICLDIPDGLQLRGEYVDESYKYIELNVIDCIDGAGDDTFAASTCASREEIDAAVQDGVKVEFSVVVQNIDLDLYHTRGMDGAIVKKQAQERFYLFPGTRLLNEVYLQGRNFYHEVPHIGSPPITPPEQAILDFGNIDSRIRAYKPSNGEHMTFFIRLKQKVRIEQTSYWTPTIMDLLGMWGAVFSFLSTMSFGLVATCYNQKKGDKSFQKRTRMLNDDDEEHGDVIMDMDIRLFNKEHFDDNGRLRLTKEEIYNPTTVFGELRRFAMIEHIRRQNAAKKLSSFFRRKFSTTSSIFKSNRVKAVDVVEAAKLATRPRHSSKSSIDSEMMVESGHDVRNSTSSAADIESTDFPLTVSHDGQQGRNHSSSRSRAGSGRYELPRQPSLTKGSCLR